MAAICAAGDIHTPPSLMAASYSIWHCPALPQALATHKAFKVLHDRVPPADAPLDKVSPLALFEGTVRVC